MVAAILLVGLSTAIAGSDATVGTGATSTQSLAGVSNGRNGSRLKWLPPRLDAGQTRADGQVIAAQYVVAEEEPPSQGAKTRTAAAVLADPFGDGATKPMATSRTPSLSAVPLRRPAVARTPERPRPVAREVAETVPAEPKEQAGLPNVLPDFPAETPTVTTSARPQILGARAEPAAEADRSSSGLRAELAEPKAEPPRSSLMPADAEPASPGTGRSGEKAVPNGADDNRQGLGPMDLDFAVKAGPTDITRKCPSAEDEEYFKPISKLSTDTTVKGDKDKPEEQRKFPQECSLGGKTFEPRSFAPLTFTWKASGLCHKPLYFEDVALERYGHSWGPLLQPIISGAHFFLVVPVLPYEMGLCPPCECVYSLGYYRPGSCAPYLLDPLPLSVRAALVEGGVWTGLVFLIP